MANQVTSKASSAEGMDSVPTSVVPGQSETKIGGPTNKNYKADDNSSKLNVTGTKPSKTAVNDKASAPEGIINPIVPDSVIPGNAKHDGSKGRSDSSGGADSVEASVAYGTKTTKEHLEVDEKASQSLGELADAQNATDDFKSKAKIIFESALNQKLQMEVSRLEEEFSARFESEIQDIAEKVEGFLNYTSQQWLEENKLVVENGIRNELSESFMQGLRSLFEDHYVTLPDEKYDIFESMVNKLDDMENKLNEQIESNVALSGQMSGFHKESVLSDVSWDLSQAAKEKLAALSESVEFESEENYRQKLAVLKESFTSDSHQTKAEYLEESAEPAQPTVYDGMSPSMAAYARVLSRTVS